MALVTTAFDAIAATRIIVSLPSLGSDPAGERPRATRLQAVVEVCVQEGLNVFTLPSDDVDLLDLMEPFEGRARFGVQGVLDADQLAAAADRTAAFAILPEASADLLRLAAERGLPAFGCALSPTEIRHTWALRPDAVVVHPAEVLGTLYVPHAVAAAPGAPLVAGGVNSYVAQQWLAKGAFAALTDDAFVGDSLADGNLSWLRDRARSFAAEGRAAPAWPSR